MWWFVDTKPVLADQVQGDLFNYIIFHCDSLAQEKTSRFRCVEAKKVTNIFVYWLCVWITATVIPTFSVETEKLF